MIELLYIILQQYILGVIEHGQEFVIYRTYENVRKDSCLAIHCMLLQIERRLTRDKQLNRPSPDVFYLQMDGGMENANKTTLAVCALLVVLKVFKTVVVTRIMRGHGHLDPDRKFGIISRAGHSKTIYTPQVHIYDFIIRCKLIFHIIDACTL